MRNIGLILGIPYIWQNIGLIYPKINLIFCKLEKIFFKLFNIDWSKFFKTSLNENFILIFIVG